MRILRICGVTLTCLTLLIMGLQPKAIAEAAEKHILASISSSRMEKGEQVQIITKLKDITFKSSDYSIAYVNTSGIVTGKKSGTVTITLNKKGYQETDFQVTVETNSKRPNIYVWYEEVSLIDEQINDGKYSAVIINNSVNNIDKIQYEFICEVETASAADSSQSPDNAVISQSPDNTINDSAYTDDGNQINTKLSTVTLTVKDISGQRGSKKIELLPPENGKIISAKLNKVLVYSKNALIVYDTKTNKYAYKWGTKDTTAPQITGLVGDNSYIGNTIFMVVYPDKKYDYTKYVSASDNRDSEVKLTVDTESVNFKREGIYTITFTATDRAGNTAKRTAKVQVRFEKKVDRMADEVLSKIVTDEMTDQQKASAIYKYIRKNVVYVGNYDETDWEKAAEYGLKYQSGDCFVYYSMSKLLLTRLGIPNMKIERFKGEGHHWWNLVFVDNGWYHFDTCPRKIMATFCLVTSKQLSEYSKKAGNSHIWDVTKYPVTATKEINKLVWGKRY